MGASTLLVWNELDRMMSGLACVPRNSIFAPVLWISFCSVELMGSDTSLKSKMYGAAGVLVDLSCVPV